MQHDQLNRKTGIWTRKAELYKGESTERATPRGSSSFLFANPLRCSICAASSPLRSELPPLSNPGPAAGRAPRHECYTMPIQTFKVCTTVLRWSDTLPQS